MSQDFEDRDPFVGRPRCWLVGVRLGSQPVLEVEEHLDELKGLATAAGGRVRGQTIQNRDKPDPGAYVGKGKAEQIGASVKEHEIDLVLFDDDLTASQIKVLEELTGAAVMDRSGLILEIFHQRARTSEARTQVELARLRYLLPRLTRRWGHLSRQQGGIGVRGGEGETQLEADRRMLRTRIQKLERDLKSIERTRKVQRRNRRGVPEVALAGYTNAGKSTLFNRLTGSHTLVRDQVFATLDSKLRRGHLAAGKVAVFADTVGFIRKLPHHLVASFRSTMGQVHAADLVLHVVDRSHEVWEEQQTVARDVLQDLEVDPERVVLVHNKIDRLNGHRPSSEPLGYGADIFEVSATTGEGVEELRRHLAFRLYGLSESASEDELWLQTATAG
ncbi:MAG: GTPase HflX [Thermoanaerobaculia bacterium]|nr:GTPase HflX [Thermoanaerobaculia bacterium]